MRVSVLGLGYVGAVISACLARDGTDTIGVDINPDKVAMVASGRAPVVEPGLAELLEAGVQSGRLTATTSTAEAVNLTDVSLISVGTPSRFNGAPDLASVFRVCTEIGKSIRKKRQPHTVVIRSTVLPGTTERCSAILRKEAGNGYVSVAFNPEFLREGSAIQDYDSPPYTIVGTASSTAERVLRELYTTIRAPVIVTEPTVAELIKYTSNAWHATKITFANEIGRLAKAFGIDGREVMRIISQDTKLNVSQAYMRPGFAYGGACLPKDVRALVHIGRSQNIALPLLDALSPSNRIQIEQAACAVLATGKRRVGLLGLAYKSATDDLRESPAVELAELLIGKGCSLRIFDAAVQEAKLVGANREYIQSKLPHVASLLVASAAELVEYADVVVVTQTAAQFHDVIDLIGADVPIIDLAGTLPPRARRQAV
jgi:GDP-mannose 6-dehydrogenase